MERKYLFEDSLTHEEYHDEKDWDDPDVIKHEEQESSMEINKEMLQLEDDIQNLLNQLKEKSNLYFHELVYHFPGTITEPDIDTASQGLDLLLDELHQAIISPLMITKLLKIAQMLGAYTDMDPIQDQKLLEK